MWRECDGDHHLASGRGDDCGRCDLPQGLPCGWRALRREGGQERSGPGRRRPLVLRGGTVYDKRRQGGACPGQSGENPIRGRTGDRHQQRERQRVHGGAGARRRAGYGGAGRAGARGCRGICAGGQHGEGERGLRAAGGVPSCAAKRVDPRPHGRRAAVRGAGRRRRDRGVRLLAPGVGPARGYRDSVARFPAGPGDCARRRLHVRLPERGRRSRVRSPRSPHPLPVMTTISRTPPRVAAVPAGETPRMILRRLRRRPLVIAAFAVLALFVILAVAAPLLAPHDPIALIPGAVLRPPSRSFPLGTDELGRDVLSRVIHGARIPLRIGLVTIGIALVLGTVIGVLAGFYGGVIDGVLMAVMEVLLAFPQILLAMAILAMLGPSLTNAMIAVGLSAVPVYARTARGTTLSVRAMDYVEAARAIGVGDGRILARHVLPNMISPVVVLATAGVGIAILIAAGLSYLGLGAQPPTPEWGAMLSQARAYLRNAWWMATFPGLAITLVVISLNLCGDWLRDLLDPRLRT